MWKKTEQPPPAEPVFDEVACAPSFVRKRRLDRKCRFDVPAAPTGDLPFVEAAQPSVSRSLVSPPFTVLVQNKPREAHAYPIVPTVPWHRYIPLGDAEGVYAASTPPERTPPKNDGWEQQPETYRPLHAWPLRNS